MSCTCGPDWLKDPVCPKCKKRYTRKRIGNTISFIVDGEHKKKCKYTGAMLTELKKPEWIENDDGSWSCKNCGGKKED